MNNAIKKAEKLGRDIFEKFCAVEMKAKNIQFTTDRYNIIDATCEIGKKHISVEIKVRSKKWSTCHIERKKVRAMMKLGSTMPLLVFIYSKEVYWITCAKAIKFPEVTISCPITTIGGNKQYIDKVMLEIPYDCMIHRSMV